VAEVSSVIYKKKLHSFITSRFLSGRGMRVVMKEEDLEQLFTTASNEAFNAFGDGRMFIERFVSNPRHVSFVKR